MRDLYEILGLKRDSTEEEIKQAYKVLAKTFHPDISKHPNAEENFIDIQNAYETLIDKDKKYEYDSSYYEGYYHDEELYEQHGDYNETDENQYYSNESTRQYNYQSGSWFDWREFTVKAIIVSLIVSSVALWSTLSLTYVFITNPLRDSGIGNIPLDELLEDIFLATIIIVTTIILGRYIWWYAMFMLWFYIVGVSLNGVENDILIFAGTFASIYIGMFLMIWLLDFDNEYIGYVSTALLIFMLSRHIIFYDIVLTLLIVMFVITIILTIFIIIPMWDDYIDVKEIVAAGFMLPIIGSIIIYVALRIDEG